MQTSETASASAFAMPPPSILGAKTTTPETLSAGRLHELALEAFRIGNRGRLSLCEALRVLDETRLYFDLGFPNVAAYAATHFHLRRAEAFEHVRVARTLVELTELREAFGEGRLGWSVVKAITRVASASSQTAWIEFAARHGVERTLAEAQDALRQRRDSPRDAASYGLPNLDQRLVLRFSRAEMDRLRRWIDAACAVIAERTGSNDVTVEQALLFLSESALIASPSSPDERENPQGSATGAGPHYPAQVVYHQCPDCRRGRVQTADGFVEVAADDVERHAGCAERVGIDGPTPPRLRRRILAREGGRCGNPRCHHLARHAHHIIYRCEGGRTDLVNEVAVCTACHALIHAGLLHVSGSADAELTWQPQPVDGPTMERTIRTFGASAHQLPVLTLIRSEQSSIADCDSTAGAAKHQAAIDSGSMVDDLSKGLERLGFASGPARREVLRAIHALPQEGRTEASVLRRAIKTLAQELTARSPQPVGTARTSRASVSES